MIAHKANIVIYIIKKSEYYTKYDDMLSFDGYEDDVTKLVSCYEITGILCLTLS